MRKVSIMQAEMQETATPRLAYVSALVIAVLLAAASVAGLLLDIYPTEALRESFVANDLINFVVGLPALLGALWSARRGQLLGQLFLPGALAYVIYNSIVYLFGLPLDGWFLVHLSLVTLSLYTIAGLLASQDAPAVRRHLQGSMPERAAGGALAGLGSLFVLLVVGNVITAASGEQSFTMAEHGLQVADVLLAGGWIIGGVLLWRRQDFGYVLGPGLLFHASTLFIGLIGVLLVQPLVTDAAFDPAAVITVGVMSLVCFVPFGMFLRRTLSMSHYPPQSP